MRKEFYDMRVRFFGTFLVVILLFFLIAPFQKFTVSILGEHSNDPILQKFLPNSFLQKLGEWNFYINTQWFGKNFGQMVPIIGIIIGFPLFAKEIENETIQYLLVRLSRRRIFLNKFLTGLMITILLIFLSSILPIIFSFVTNKNYNAVIGLKFTVHSIFAGILWYSIAMFYSIISDDSVKPLLISLCTLAITTVAGLLKPLKFLNTFTYSLGLYVFQRNIIDLKYTLSVIIIVVLLTLLAQYIFVRREF
ncbi:MAG: ABC transporter permease subunit [Fervidobacterium sp.]